MSLAVDYYDNRGSEEYPFGFVYFNDDRRVAYTRDGVVRDATGGWEPITVKHEVEATVYLKREGVLKD